MQAYKVLLTTTPPTEEKYIKLYTSVQRQTLQSDIRNVQMKCAIFTFWLSITKHRTITSISWHYPLLHSFRSGRSLRKLMCSLPEILSIFDYVEFQAVVIASTQSKENQLREIGSGSNLNMFGFHVGCVAHWHFVYNMEGVCPCGCSLHQRLDRRARS